MEKMHILQLTLNLLLVITQGNAQRQCTFTALRESSRSEDDSDRFTREIRCCSDYTCGGFNESQVLDSSWFNNPVYQPDQLYMLKNKVKETFFAPINAANAVEFNIPGGLRAGRDIHLSLTALDGILSSSVGINLCCTDGKIPLHINLRRSTSDIVFDSVYGGNYQSSILRAGILNFNVGSRIEVTIETNSTGFSLDFEYGTRRTDYMAYRFSPNCGTVLKIQGMVEINQIQFSDNNSY
ncbi:hypothetical protein ACJMK2_033036 [Sinanodonta woodiana]|uniref:Galectin n=1 Tax=Sinanodonta woodiana TaxID=1069815 RepID=A0ABD3X533_SINWO